MAIDEQTGVARPRRSRSAKAKGAAPLGTVFSPKQAVVVIHGMGEQRPLETLREFVRTVYQLDPKFGADALADGNPISMVPDSATGSSELRRITTHSKVGHRTDFFEFYWADVMNGTPLELVTSWISGLLIRSPFRVPPSLRIWLAWLTLWAIALALVFLAGLVFYPAVFDNSPIVLAARDWLRLERFNLAYAMAGLGGLLILWRLIRTRPLAHAKLLLPGALIAIAALLYLMPPELAADVRVWATILWVFFGWLFTAMVGPYLGDVVRYVRATPQTVGKRKEVRERGLALLRALHDQKGPDGEPYYRRIVIVGHSLGSIVAYDLLQLFWEEAGPTHRWYAKTPNAAPWMPSAGTARAMAKANLHVVAAANNQPFNAKVFATDQREFCEELGKDEPKWRISDLITLGSPLSHSDFLVTDSKDQLEENFAERRFSTSPPRPDPVLPAKSMTYFEGNRGPFAHFASVFSAVRWTNIYDKHWFPLLGDIVSGDCQPLFGEGIEDHRVKITRPIWIPIAARFFTHTRYWSWHKSYDPGAPPQHIAILRSALDLGRP
jgi:hypothetical protein